MSLREDLAKRLAKVLNGAIVRAETTPEGFPGMTRADMGPVADECIRQMEWARQRCGRESAPPTYTEYGSRPIHGMGALKTLTLAPPDWNP